MTESAGVTRRDFMVEAMEIIGEWREENDVQTTNREEYELAERLWALWQTAAKGVVEPREATSDERSP